MPHLSPMNWMIAPLMFLMIFTPMIIASLWWAQTPYLPTNMVSSSQQHQLNTWNWS